MSSPVSTAIDPRYSSPRAEATSWEQTREILESANIFWLTTVRADGRPHLTPLVAVWVEGAVHFTTGPDEQKFRNLSANPHVIVSTGHADWQSGVDVVVEGAAEQHQSQELLDAVATAFGPKWDGDTWNFTTHDGQFFHPEGFRVEIFSVRPVKVLAFAKGTFGHTLHTF